jgi:SAM-dependent methyltransferase
MLYADSGGVPQRLNLGCAGFYAAGWVNVDLDPDAPAEFHEDVQDLPSIADGIAVEIYAGHVLEHVEHVGRALRTWYRVLAPNGTLTVAVPDLPGALALWHAKAHFPGLDLAAGAGLLAVVCGLKDPTEFAAKPLSQHRRFFDSSSLALCMEAVGFRDLHQVDAHPLMVMPSSQLGWQVAVCGTKACG